MPIPAGYRRALGPVRDPISFISYDPVSKTAISFLREVAGIYRYGVRFPFNNDSTTDLTVTGGTTTLTNKVNRYRDIEITSTGILTGSATLSPILIFCRDFTIEASGLLHVDALGPIAGAGGAAGGGDPANDGGAGAQSDRGGTYVTDVARDGGGATAIYSPPQFWRGWSSGAGGGGGGGGGGGDAGGENGKEGGDGGIGGRAYGTQTYVLQAGTGGTKGFGGGASPVAGSSPIGAVGANIYDNLDYLQALLDFVETHNGGAGGGGGGAGGQGYSSTAGGAGGIGGAGGGILIVCCERWNNSGTARSNGGNGTAGANGTNGAGAGLGGGGGGGGGAGGGGGMIVVMCIESINDGTFTATGGAGGAAGTGGSAGAGAQAGAAGGAGRAGASGETHIFKGNA